MQGSMFHRKDFWAGVLYVALGAGAFLIARGYAMGTAARMGAGYFPTVLSLVLIGIGLASVLKAATRGGEAVEGLALKPVLLVTASTVLFGLLLERAGLVLALGTLLLVSAAASRHFRLDLRSGLGLVLFVAACSLVFVKALGVPMPLFGNWFGE